MTVRDGVRRLKERFLGKLRGGPGRIRFLDALRGGAVAAMVCYHLWVDFYTQGLIGRAWLYNPWLDALQKVIACTFIVLCGVSCRFSRNNLRRGLEILAAAGVVTLVSWLFSPELIIVYGVLHFLATAVLLYALAGKLAEKLPVFVLPVLCLAGAVLTWRIPQQVWDVNGLWIFGFRNETFRSADYFPLLPNLFIFLFGTWLGGFLAARRGPERLYRLSCPPLELLGRLAIWIYLIHQPLCMGVTLLIKALI